MNLPRLLLRRAPAAFALFAVLFPIPAGRAQPSSQIADSRFLFIFDTSADMKRRLPAVAAEVNDLMSTSLGGQLHAGDSLGVWAFDQDLRTGQFPLQHWRPEDAVTIASNINKFVSRQRYANGTRFNALQPQLNQVIQNSGRLTVLIFCDGEDEIKWTPFDDGINRVFQQRLAEQKRARRPFVLVLRTQLGQYAGCTMNFPPGAVSVPEFPPPPEPPEPVKTPPAAPPPAPVIKPPIGSPLIIIGKKVETNWPPEPGPTTPTNAVPTLATNAVASTNQVAPPLPTNPAPAVQTNAAQAPSANSFAPTNPVAPKSPVAPPPPTNPAPAVQTNATPAPSASSFVATNSVAPENPVAPPPPTNPAPEIQTNAPPVSPAGSFAPTNSVAPRNPVAPTINAPLTFSNLVPIPQSKQMAPTNAVAQSPETSGLSHKGALAIGGALLVAAGALAALAFFRSRRTGRGSLITRSMRKD
jgi:hypothetical protein